MKNKPSELIDDLSILRIYGEQAIIALS